MTETILIEAIDREGGRNFVPADVGETLMEALHKNAVDVEAVCGGACSCATCHVYVDADWFNRLPKCGEEESMLLDALVHTQPQSRLSCQLEVDEWMDGMLLRIAPAEE